MNANSSNPTRPGRLLTFRSGGWVLALAAAFTVGVLLWGTAGIFSRGVYRMRGNGLDVASYGFDLTTCRVPRDQIVAAGFAKDAVPAMTNPGRFTPAEADAFDHELRRGHEGKFLVPTDRVIGVVVNGQARAYPLRILNWHEIANDTLGGEPIVVTYNPLCDSAVVFKRRVGDEMPEFGVSGLLYQSNLLMYDRRAGATGESLWSQLQFRAIAGPAAQRGAQLELVPLVVTHWSEWWKRYPETTILAPDRSRMKIYQRTYDAYFGSEKLHFPVTPRPPGEAAVLKTPIVAVRSGVAWHVFSMPELVARAGASGTIDTTLDGRAVRFDCRSEPLAVWPESGVNETIQTVYAFWFAWYAQYPGSVIESP